MDDNILDYVCLLAKYEQYAWTESILLRLVERTEMYIY